MARGGGRRARSALIRGFRDAIRRAVAQIERAERHPETAVHEWRRQLRRARAIVRLSRPFVDARTEAELTTTLRAAYRASGRLRDTDVLARALASAGDEAARLASHVGAERTRLRRRGAARSLLAAQRPALQALPARFSIALEASIGVDDLGRALARSYRRVRRSGRLAARTRVPADVHDFRKRVKALQYQLEVVERVPGLDATAARGRAAKLADVLGRVTDAQLVTRLILDSKAEVSARARTRLIRRLDARRTERLDRALTRAERLTAVRPRRFRRSLLAA